MSPPTASMQNTTNRTASNAKPIPNAKPITRPARMTMPRMRSRPLKSWVIMDHIFFTWKPAEMRP